MFLFHIWPCSNRSFSTWNCTGAGFGFNKTFHTVWPCGSVCSVHCDKEINKPFSGYYSQFGWKWNWVGRPEVYMPASVQLIVNGWRKMRLKSAAEICDFHKSPQKLSSSLSDLENEFYLWTSGHVRLSCLPFFCCVRFLMFKVCVLIFVLLPQLTCRQHDWCSGSAFYLYKQCILIRRWCRCGCILQRFSCWIVAIKSRNETFEMAAPLWGTKSSQWISTYPSCSNVNKINADQDNLSLIICDAIDEN